MAGGRPGGVSPKKRAASSSRRSLRFKRPTSSGATLLPRVVWTFDGQLPDNAEGFRRDSGDDGDVAVPHGLSLAAGNIGLATKRAIRLPAASTLDGPGAGFQVDPTNMGLGMCRTVMAVLCFLVGSSLLLMRTAPASHFVLRHSAYDRLVIRNTTTGFHTNGDFEVLEGSYKSWYFFNVSFDWNKGFLGNPNFSTLGPYTMKQYIKTVDVWFEDDVAYKSTAIYGKFIPEYSCSTCQLDNKITILNEMYMQMLAFYQYDELQVLRQYVPEVISRFITEAAVYFMQNNISSPGRTARDYAIQQFADCSPLNGSSIRDVPNSTFFSTVYAPEFCSWSQTWTKKGKPPVYMTYAKANQFLYAADYALLVQRAQSFLAVTNIIKLCNPSEGVLLELPGFTFELTVAIIEYLDFVAQTLGKELYQQRINTRFAGLFMTRTVREVLYGYTDPWLKFRFGDNVTNSSTYVAQIYDYATINYSVNNLSTVNAYTGINTGQRNISHLSWVTQQAMLSDAPLNLVTTVNLNASEIQWQYGVVQVNAPSGAVFGRVQPEGNLTMWLSPWLRHVNLEYIGTGSQHGLKTHKYRMADFSLAACSDPFPENVEGEGPCLYPNEMQGITDMTGFQGGSMESFPMFYRADPRAIETWGEQSLKLSTFIPDDFEFRMDVEPYFGVSVNVSFWIQKLYWVRPSPLIYPLMDVGDGILFPVSYYHIQMEANESVCTALSAGAWTLAAIAFVTTTVLPLVGLSCIMCGIHIAWRKRALMCCHLICIEEDVGFDRPQEVVIAHPMVQFRQFMEDEMRLEANRAAELSWRQFSQQLGEHDAHYRRIKENCDAHPIAVRPKPVTRSSLGDRQKVVQNLGQEQDKGKDADVNTKQEGDHITSGLEKIAVHRRGGSRSLSLVEVENSVLGAGVGIAMSRGSSGFSFLKDDEERPVPRTVFESLTQNIDESSVQPELGNIAVHRRGASRTLSLMEVEKTGLAARIAVSSSRGSSRFGSLKEDEERPLQGTRFKSSKQDMDDERAMQRTQRSSSRAKSIVVVEEGRALIDLIKARKAGLAATGSNTSLAATTEPDEELDPVSESQ